MHERPTVEISVAEFYELAKGKAIADALTALIHNKQRHYEGFSIEEVRILDGLYFVGEEA